MNWRIVILAWLILGEYNRRAVKSKESRPQSVSQTRNCHVRISVAVVAATPGPRIFIASRLEAIAFFTRRRVDTTSRVLSDSRFGSIRLLSARLDFESRRPRRRESYRPFWVSRDNNNPGWNIFGDEGDVYFLKSAVHARQREPRRAKNTPARGHKVGRAAGASPPPPPLRIAR